MNNELLLQSKNDIPFPEAQITIHQPTINEISLIGEENFFAGCQLFNFSKDKLSDEDKTGLEDKDNFDIFMSIVNSKEKIKYKNSVLLLLTLLFPSYMIKFTETDIILISQENSSRINKENFDVFKDILNAMFLLSEIENGALEYNPVDARAKKIADKLKKFKEKNARSKEQQESKVAILSTYVSILSVGLQKDKNQLMEYTVFQLKDEFQRYQKKQSFDVYVQAKMAGATELEEVDNWMEKIHP